MTVSTNTDSRFSLFLFVRLLAKKKKKKNEPKKTKKKKKKGKKEEERDFTLLILWVIPASET